VAVFYPYCLHCHDHVFSQVANRRWRGSFCCRGSRRAAAVFYTLNYRDFMQISSRDIHAAIAIGSCFLLFGTSASLGAFFMFRRSYREVNNWKTASGTVVWNKFVGATQTSDSMPHYYPTFQFITDDGKEVTSVGPVGSSRPRYRVGASVKVLYSPDNPEKAQLNSFTDLWLMPILLGFFGLAFGGISLFLFIHLIIYYLTK
jgi:hypothetical protein